MSVVVGRSWIDRLQSRANSECGRGDAIADDERPAAAETVDKGDAQSFSDEREDRVDTLQSWKGVSLRDRVEEVRLT